MNRNEFAPGSPQGIHAVAVRISHTAELSFQSARELQSILGVCADIRWHGRGEEAFTRQVADLPSDLTRMARSYSTVSSALHVYANELEDISSRVDQAIARYELARVREAQAASEVSRASARLGQLKGQLITARAEEYSTKLTYNASLLAGGDPGAYQLYLRARDWRSRLDSDYSATTQTKNQHEAIRNSANKEIAAERARLGGLREQREQAESLCANKINDALEADLRNRSWLERNLPKTLVQLAKGLSEGAYKLRMFLSKASLALMILSVPLAVGAFFLGGPVAVALGAVLWAGLGVAALSLGTGLLLSLTGFKLPGSNKEVVDGGDLAGDAVDVAFAAIGVKAFSLAKAAGTLGAKSKPIANLFEWAQHGVAMHSGPAKYVTAGAGAILDVAPLSAVLTRTTAWVGNHLLENFRRNPQTIGGRCFAR